MGRKELRSGKVNSQVVELGPKLTLNQQLTLMQPFSEQDIKAALWFISEIKSPGPDGYNSGFFKRAWDHVATDFCTAVIEFFAHGRLLRSFNRTNLVLLPKTESLRGPEDFRPIACCSTVYKCIAKLLCSRLQLVLPFLIDENQAAFVEGRSILHNVLIGQELLRLYAQKNTSPRLLMKIDIKKAYDFVSWDFLSELFTCLNFPQKFKGRLLECVSSTSYSFVLNETPLPSFNGQRRA